MNTHSTIFAKATLEHDPEHELELIEAITRTIFETSVVSDVNAIVLRTGETAEVLITILAGVLAMSPSVARSPTAHGETITPSGRRTVTTNQAQHRWPPAWRLVAMGADCETYPKAAHGDGEANDGGGKACAVSAMATCRFLHERTLRPATTTLTYHRRKTNEPQRKTCSSKKR